MACDADKDVGFEQEKQPVIGSQAVDRAGVANGLSSEVALHHQVNRFAIPQIISRIRHLPTRFIAGLSTK
jgi:hypothetical protein